MTNCPASAHNTSLLNELLESRERAIPLTGNFSEVGPRFVQSIRFELPNLLTPAAHATHQAGAGEYVQMFGDSLTRDFRAGGEP